MIYAEISEGEDTVVKIKGHADEKVCAAVSGLFYALLAYLEESGSAIKKSTVEPGEAELVFNCENKEAFKMFTSGLYGIEKEHKESLHTVKY